MGRREESLGGNGGVEEGWDRTGKFVGRREESLGGNGRVEESWDRTSLDCN